MPASPVHLSTSGTGRPFIGPPFLAVDTHGSIQPWPGWLFIQLVRGYKPMLRQVMSHVRPPATLAVAAAFMPDPPAVYLQAVNRSSVY